MASPDMPIARGRLPTPCVSAHLLTLRKMKLPTAVDIAIERFDKTSDMPPEEAAAAYVAMEERGKPNAALDVVA